MSCQKCEDEPIRGAFYRWKNTNIEIIACKEHWLEIKEALSRPSKQGVEFKSASEVFIWLQKIHWADLNRIELSKAIFAKFSQPTIQVKFPERVKCHTEPMATCGGCIHNAAIDEFKRINKGE